MMSACSYSDSAPRGDAGTAAAVFFIAEVGGIACAFLYHDFVEAVSGVLNPGWDQGDPSFPG